MRKYVLLALPVLASGCALPPALVVASYGADGLSYLSSGKSLGDHGISTVLDEDCALHRFLDDKPICRDFNPPYEGLLLEPAPPPPEAAQNQPPAPPTETASEPGKSLATGEVALALAAIPNDVADEGPRRFLVLGSFTERENAVRLTKRLGETGVAVVPAAVGGRTVYRVVAGPFTATEVAQLRTQLAGKTPETPWDVASLPPGSE
ncbi:MAG TPA: SPOR domain-containing protein [Stellaceae bacterium]|nr:SPOR domain-containing protein [Stellaceae bacterium]